MTNRAEGELAVRCSGLVKRYGDVVAVNGLDLEVRRGECFGLLGPNGAGKTTTIEILEGLLPHDAGDVEVLGSRWGVDDDRLRERLGIQLQETQLLDKLTVFETLRLFRSFYRRGRSIDDVLSVVELTAKAQSRVGALSGGQKQRLAVGCALVGAPDLLFLDEPTTGLDPQSRRQLWSLLERYRAEGGTILLTTHYMDEAQTLCDRVAIVDHGRVIALGTPRELIASLGAANVIAFAVEDGGSEIARADLEALPGVHGVSWEDGVIHLIASEVHVTVPALLRMIAERGRHLAQLTTHGATLEDVFVHLTGRHLRDV
ncbi:MAG TPA: ABC transporter ATP-binding protein [Vicinamibacterales bacterium]|nr:ABC transporter ATP-binding protein [Vicinamibacterales bacterium]